MTARSVLAVLFLLASLVPARALAAEWGGITPGESDVESVRQRYGAPSREQREKVEGHDTLRWIYEGEKAPRGLSSMEVSFGLLASGSYRPRTVRYFRLVPRAGIFTKEIVLTGWGEPSRVGKEKEQTIFFYQSGLVIYFDREELNAISMVFGIPQPEPPPSR
jgi:hypothetical protein